MQRQHDYQAMARQLLEDGFDPEQLQRYELAFEAAKTASVWLMSAKYGLPARDLVHELRRNGALASELDLLVARMEVCPAFVGYIHSGLRF